MRTGDLSRIVAFAIAASAWIVACGGAGSTTAARERTAAGSACAELALFACRQVRGSTAERQQPHRRDVMVVEDPEGTDTRRPHAPPP